MVVAPPFASLFFPSVDVYDWDERDDGEAWADCVEWGAYEDEPVGRGCVVSICLFGWVDV